MELWIRSQDKNRLTKVADLYIVHDDNNFCDYIGNNMVGHLAKYTKQGRALEVLDEIQRILQPIIFMSGEINTDNNNWVENGIIFKKYKDNFESQKLDTYVYEMPEE